MKQIPQPALRAARIYRRAKATQSARPAQSAGVLAGIMLLYTVVVVGRLADAVPGLSFIPLAKISVAIAILVALQSRDSMSSSSVWSLGPARLTLIIMALITVSIFFSVLKSGTLGVITGTVLSVSIGLVLMVKAARNWVAIRTMLLGCVVSAVVLALSARVTSYAGRAGDISSLDPNDFAFVLVGLFPVVVTFAVVSKGLWKAGFTAISFWVVLTILLTESRGGLLGLSVDILVIIPLLPAMRRGQLTSRPSALTIAARFATLVLVGILAWHATPESARTRLASITSLDSDYNMNADGTGRVAIWTHTLPLALQRPWGWGAGAFPTVDGMFAGGRFKAPHNMFLQAAIELGILGFALFLATIASSLRSLAREFLAPVEPMDQDGLERHAFARGITASLLGMCVSGFFLSELYSGALWTMVVFSCLVGRAAVTAPHAPARETLRRTKPSPASKGRRQ